MPLVHFFYGASLSSLGTGGTVGLVKVKGVETLQYLPQIESTKHADTKRAVSPDGALAKSILILPSAMAGCTVGANDCPVTL